MLDDGQRPVAGHAQPADIERHRRPRHVGNQHVGQHRQRIDHAAAAIQRGQRAEQPGHADQRDIGRDDRLGLPRHRLGGTRRIADRLQALERIGHIGRQADQAQRGLGAHLGVALLAQRDRHRGDQRLARDRVVALEVAAQRAAAQGQHHVIDRRIVRRGNRLQLGTRHRRRGEAALGSDRDVEGSARTEGNAALQLAEIRRMLASRLAARSAGGTLDDACQGTHHARQFAHQLDVLRGIVAEGRGDQRQRARLGGRQLGLRRSRPRLALRRRRIRRGIEQGTRQRDAGLAVEHGVVNLEVVGLLAAGQAFQHVHHPQRARTIKQLGMQIRHRGFELRPGARLRQAHAADVPVEVDLALQPDRVRQMQRQRRQPAAQHGHHAAIHHVPHRGEKVGLVAGRRLEQMQRADMHRRRRGFEIQKRAVDTAEGFDP